MGLSIKILEGRRFRRTVVAQWAAPGAPAPLRLFGKGRFIQHYAPDRSSTRALCGGRILLVSDQPFTTITKLQCPLCVSVVARVLVLAAARDAASSK